MVGAELLGISYINKIKILGKKTDVVPVCRYCKDKVGRDDTEESFPRSAGGEIKIIKDPV